MARIIIRQHEDDSDRFDVIVDGVHLEGACAAFRVEHDRNGEVDFPRVHLEMVATHLELELADADVRAVAHEEGGLRARLRRWWAGIRSWRLGGDPYADAPFPTIGDVDLRGYRFGEPAEGEELRVYRFGEPEPEDVVDLGVVRPGEPPREFTVEPPPFGAPRRSYVLRAEAHDPLDIPPGAAEGFTAAAGAPASAPVELSGIADPADTEGRAVLEDAEANLYGRGLFARSAEGLAPRVAGRATGDGELERPCSPRRAVVTITATGEHLTPDQRAEGLVGYRVTGRVECGAILEPNPIPVILTSLEGAELVEGPGLGIFAGSGSLWVFRPGEDAGRAVWASAPASRDVAHGGYEDDRDATDIPGRARVAAILARGL